MDYGKHGSMREIEQTDLRNVFEYPKWKAAPQKAGPKLVPVDQVSWL
jgi:hypothetical protein